jgi:hypothetical protein
MPSSPVASMMSPEENSIMGTNGKFLGLEEGDLDRLVNKASQVVDIFEKAKKRVQLPIIYHSQPTSHLY